MKSSFQISRFNQTLLLSFTLLVLIPYVFAVGIRNKLGEFFYSELFFHSIALIAVPVAGLVGFSLILDIFHPFYFILRKLKPRQINPSMIPKNYQRLCENFGLPNVPSILVSDVADSPFSLGVHRGKSMVILPRYVLDFEEEEIESIIAHELWHITTDVEAAYFWLFEVLGGKILVSFSGMICLAILIEHEMLGWWTKQIRIETSLYTAVFDLYSMNILWLFVIILFLPYSFSKLAMLLRTFSGFPAFLRPDYREYLADGSASLITEKPKIMARSLTKSRRSLAEKVVIEAFVQKIGFINPRTLQKAKPQKWQEIFSSKFTKRKHPSDRYRISLLHLLDSILNSQVELIWKKKTHRFSFKLLVNFLFFASFVNFGKIFLSIASQERWKIINYMWKNRNAFNLIVCANKMRVTRHDTFLVFFLLLSEGIIDVKNPQVT